MQKSKISLFFTIIFGFLLAMPLFSASAATLYFRPISGNISVGDIIQTDVLVDTKGANINASEATVAFPVDLLDVVSVSKTNSIFTMWVQEPSFSNLSGTVSFSGGLPTPGFTGSAGRVISVVFRAKKAGSSSLYFSSASVLANDGMGTELIESTGKAVFTATQAAANIPVTTPPPSSSVEENPSSGDTPSAPIILSSTHPNQDGWYSLTTAKYSWPIDQSITSCRTIISHSASLIPNVVYTPSIRSKTVDNLDDGVWYFSVQLKNNNGWGKVATYKTQIDTTAPTAFDVLVKEGNETNNPQPTISFKSTDSVSGIDYYEIRIDNNDPFRTQQNDFQLPKQNPGKHTVIVKAVDKAGNSTVSVADIKINTIESPKIEEYSKTVQTDSSFIVKGSSVLNSVVALHVSDGAKDISVDKQAVDVNGSWIAIVSSPSKAGIYDIWAEATDYSGAQSSPSPTFTVEVKAPVFARIGTLDVTYAIVIRVLIATVIFLLIGVSYLMRRLITIKMQLREHSAIIHKRPKTIEAKKKSKQKKPRKVKLYEIGGEL
jgi:hypothetical protein